jgi:hypothetical protein
MGSACETYGEVTNIYEILMGTTERKKPLGRTRHRWEDIKMDLQEIGFEGVDSINLVQDRVQ